MRKYLMTALMAGGMMAGLGLSPRAAYAQTAIEGRVGRLESEMRAVQRKVFPGGSGQYVQPDINPPTASTAIPGSPSSSPIADLDARVNALESQVATMTGQIETTQHRVQQLEDAFNAYKRTTDARLKVLEENASSVGTGSGVGTNSGAMRYRRSHNTRMRVADVRELVSSAMWRMSSTGRRVKSATEATGPREPIPTPGTNL